jgi:hypothetical protein
MIDLFKKPKKLSWWTSLKLLWAVVFARLYYWWTGKIRIQYMKQGNEMYGSVRLSGSQEIVRIVKLPTKFKLLFTTGSDGKMTFECETFPQDEGDLEWLDVNHVVVNEVTHKLKRCPSLILVQHPDQEPVKVRDKLFYPAAEERLKFTVFAY